MHALKSMAHASSIMFGGIAMMCLFTVFQTWPNPQAAMLAFLSAIFFAGAAVLLYCVKMLER